MIEMFQTLARCSTCLNLTKAIKFFSTFPLPMKKPPHTPVLLEESIKYLKPNDGDVIIDMTFGAGGHSKRLLDSANCTVIALDRDPIAHKYSVEMATEYPKKLIPLLGRFSELPSLLAQKGFGQNSIDGMLFDFGCSSMQMDSSERGFAISSNALLDMRMDADRFPEQLTARQVLALATEQELRKIFRIYGDEKKAIKIAKTIIDARYLFKKIETTKELADLVDSVCEDEVRLDKLHRFSSNATKVFQALRIFVNNELNEINYGMIIAKHYLKLNGRLVTISFHSLEDTIVKRHIVGNLIEDRANPVPLKYFSMSMTHDHDTMSELLKTCLEPINKHVIVPTDEEVARNPRSRSARLRAAIKVTP